MCVYPIFVALILNFFPSWLNETFPDWELVSAEELLYEPYNEEINFKGFIDCILKVPTNKSKTKHVYWLLDWKTTGPSGWWYKKRRDFLSLSQIGYYKQFWAQKNKINLKSIRTGFVFLKRTSNPKKPIEILKVSSGPKFLEKTEKLLKTMIYNVRKGFKMKNQNSCKFCQFKQTEHCDAGEW